MSDLKSEKNNTDPNQSLVSDHYDGSADTYHLQYERNLIKDLSRVYPGNYFRLQLLVNSFVKNNIKKVVEIGVGEGTPLVTLSKLGMEVSGCDISKKMVETCKNNFQKNNLDKEDIIWADIQDPVTYSALLKRGKFEGLLAMGVMPHVDNERYVLCNMRDMVDPGGRVFIEFRNKFFSLFTFNRYTYEFIMDDLLEGVDIKLKNMVSENLKNRLEMDEPKRRLEGKSADLIDDTKNKDLVGYDAILSKFHNPFEILELFNECGFEDSNLLWYHYHPAFPYLAKKDERLFRDEALKLEHENSNWKEKKCLKKY